MIAWRRKIWDLFLWNGVGFEIGGFLAIPFRILKSQISNSRF